MKLLFSAIALCVVTSSALSQVTPYDLATNDRGLLGNRLSDTWTELGRDAFGYSVGYVHFGETPFDNFYQAQNPGGTAHLIRRNGETANSADAGIYAGSGGLISSSMPVAFANLINSGQVTKADVDAYMGGVQFGAWGTPTGQSILAVETNSIVAGLQTLVLQIEIQGHPNFFPNSDGYLTPYEMANYAYPVMLYLNGSSDGIMADFSEVVWAGPHKGDSGYMPGDENRSEVFALQWDLSGYADEITSLSIDFWLLPHSSLTGLRLDQSDYYTQVVAAPIPEPGSIALLLCAAGGWMMVRRGHWKRRP